MIAIYGGSFDPPHRGHFHLVESFWKLFPDCKRLFLVPNKISPFKEKKFTQSTEIIEMLNLLLEEGNFSKTEISQKELERTEKSYSILTIREFALEYANEEIYFLIGMDNLRSFAKWKDYAEILTLARLLVFQRPGYAKELSKELEIYKNRILFMNNSVYEISSTEIRNFIVNSKKLVTPKVYEYIQKKGLYGYRTTN